LCAMVGLPSLYEFNVVINRARTVYG
jgi:hypothetical protein